MVGRSFQMDWFKYFMFNKRINAEQLPIIFKCQNRRCLSNKLSFECATNICIQIAHALIFNDSEYNSNDILFLFIGWRGESSW